MTLDKRGKQMKKFMKTMVIVFVAMLVVPAMFLVGCGIKFTGVESISFSQDVPSVSATEYIDIGTVSGSSVDSISMGSFIFKEDYECKLNNATTTAKAYKFEDKTVKVLSVVLFCEGYDGRIGIDGDWFNFNYSRSVSKKTIQECSCTDTTANVKKNSSSSYALTFQTSNDDGKEIKIKTSTTSKTGIIRVTVNKKLLKYSSCDISDGTLSLGKGLFHEAGANKIEVKIYTKTEIFSVTLSATFTD